MRRKLGYRCEGSESRRFSRAAGQQRVAHGFERNSVVVGKTYSHNICPVVADHRRRRRFAFQDRGGVKRNLLRSESGPGSHTGIDLERDRRSADRVFNSIKYIDHALNFADRLSDLRRPAFQKRGILREQFDLYRFRFAGEIADHVLQDLHEFDSHRRLLGRYLRPHVFYYVVNGAAAIFLQFDQDVAAIGFCDRRQSQFHSRAPRRTLNFRDGVEDLLHARHHAVGFRQRCSGRSPVVQREPAFIHFRHQIRPRIAIADIGDDYQRDTQAGEP